MIPDFHDGYLDGLFVSKPRALIFLRTARGDKFTLTLLEVQRFYAENFREGNIIFSLDFFEPDQVNAENVKLTYGYGTDNDASSFSMEKWVTEAKKRGLRMLEISSSYGCTVLAIFKEHELPTGYTI